MKRILHWAVKSNFCCRNAIFWKASTLFFEVKEGNYHACKDMFWSLGLLWHLPFLCFTEVSCYIGNSIFCLFLESLPRKLRCHFKCQLFSLPNIYWFPMTAFELKYRVSCLMFYVSSWIYSTHNKILISKTIQCQKKK